MDTAVRPSGQMPVFLPIGSEGAAGEAATEDIEIIPAATVRRNATPVPARGTYKIPQTALPDPPPPPAARRPSALWLAGAALCVLGGAASFVLGNVQGGDTSQHAAAIDANLDKIASAFEQSLRSAHIKAEGIAAAPILRAAIETDAVTVRDVVTNEYVFSIAKGEVIEIFQHRGDAFVSLVRLPATGAAVAPPKAGEIRVDVSAGSARVLVGAPIASSKAAVGGLIVVAMPVDLSAPRRALEAHVAEASIDGFGSPVVLVPPRDAPHGEPVKLALPSSGEWTAGAATLTAVPLVKPSSASTWMPLRYGGFGSGALFLLLYTVAWLRRRS